MSFQAWPRRWFTLTNIWSQHYIGQAPLKQTPGDCPPFSATANKVLTHTCLHHVISKADAQTLYYLINKAIPRYVYYTIILYLKKLRSAEVTDLLRAMELIQEPACQWRRCKRLSFDPWVKKIPWSRKWQTRQYSCLGNSMDRAAWRAMVHRATKSRTRLSNWASTRVVKARVKLEVVCKPSNLHLGGFFLPTCLKSSCLKFLSQL